jgi:uncharacterized protein YkwD
LIKLVRSSAALIVLPILAAGIVLAAPAAPSSAAVSSTTTLANQVVSLTNKYRVKHHCAKVRNGPNLAKSARAHSAYQAKRSVMTHTGSGGTNFVTRARRASYYHAIGENVAYGYTTASAVVTAWMKSPGHRANILNCKAKAVGVGVAYNGRRVPYWTQVFGRV